MTDFWLRFGNFETVEPLSGGSTMPSLITIGDIKAVWKPCVGFRREILAYRLSEAIGFNLVPVTVERIFQGKSGSLQLYVAGVEKKVIYPTFTHVGNKHVPTGPPIISNADQIEIAKQEAFDFLIGNMERTLTGNWVLSESGRVVSIDHEKAFLPDGRRPFTKYRNGMDRFLLSEYAKPILKKLNNVDFSLGQDVLTSREMSCLRNRANVMLRYWEFHNLVQTTLD